MEWAALAVSIFAVAMSAAALVFQLRREKMVDRRAQEADQRDKDRFLREEAAARATRMGRPTTHLLAPEPGPGRTYRFRVVNIGKAAMWDVKPMLVDGSGKIVSDPLPSVYLPPLAPGADEEFVIEVSSRFDRNPLYLRYEWGDEYGKRERLSNVEVPDK